MHQDLTPGVMTGLAWYYLRHTAGGRHFYAIGGDAHAARLAGIAVQRRTLLAYVITGLLVGSTPTDNIFFPFSFLIYRETPEIVSETMLLLRFPVEPCIDMRHCQPRRTNSYPYHQLVPATWAFAVLRAQSLQLVRHW